MRSGLDVLRGALEYLRAKAREARGRGESLDADDLELHNEVEREARSHQAREAARQKRRKRGPSPENKLRMHALRCVLDESPNVTAEMLLERLDADGKITYDDDDVELALDAGGDIIVRDLKTKAKTKTAPIKASSLRKYLADARNA